MGWDGEMTFRTFGLAAALLMPTVSLQAQAPAAAEFVVHINEPFYSFATSGGTVMIVSPNDLEGTVVPVQRMVEADVTQVMGVYEGEAFALVIVKAACEDDMAGSAYSHRATLVLAGETTDGCARLATEPQPREDG